MTRKIFTLVLLFATCALYAQKTDWLADLEAHPEYLDGTDMLCPTAPVKLTKAPKGYKPFYISHYARHGARFASQSDMYKWLNEVFGKAAKDDNLTEAGKEFKRKFDLVYPDFRYRTGELSSVGWWHQKALAERMYSNFPEVFPDGAAVTARTSTNPRCLMTMSSFCLGLKEKSPKISVEEKFGRIYTPAVIPQDSGNPFKKDYEKGVLGFDETLEHFIGRTVDYKAILARLFTDVDKALPAGKQWDFTSYLYFFANGMTSTGSDIDFRNIFTHEERVALWKVDDFQFYYDMWQTRPGYMPVVEDIIARADERIASGQPGADLRFAHDYTFLPVLMLLNVNGYGTKVTDPDEIPVWCRLYDVPMGANLHLVFYKNKKNPKVLFRVLLNGSEARLPQLSQDHWPCYDWDELKLSL